MRLTSKTLIPNEMRLGRPWIEDNVLLQTEVMTALKRNFQLIFFHRLSWTSYQINLGKLKTCLCLLVTIWTRISPVTTVHQRKSANHRTLTQQALETCLWTVVGGLGTRRVILATQQDGKWKHAWYVDDCSKLVTASVTKDVVFSEFWDWSGGNKS